MMEAVKCSKATGTNLKMLLETQELFVAFGLLTDIVFVPKHSLKYISNFGCNELQGCKLGIKEP
jgi:hypothetical protein